MEHGEAQSRDKQDLGSAPADLKDSSERRLRSTPADQLDVHGGFVVLGGGLVLTALACVFAGEATVAPIFAVLGPALIVIGAFYSRIKGPLQAGRGGFSFAVDAAQRLAQEKGYPPDITEQIPERVAEVVESPRISAHAAEDAADYVVRSFSSDVRAREMVLLDHFGTWLEEKGLSTVRKHVRAHGVEYDLIAENADTVMIVEAKLGPKTVGNLAVRQVLAMPPPADPHAGELRRALVVPYELKISQAAIDIAVTQGLEVYEVSDDGGIKRVV